jgi:hypothetical protein
VEFDVFIVMVMNITVFWNIMPCSLKKSFPMFQRILLPRVSQGWEKLYRYEKSEKWYCGLKQTYRNKEKPSFRQSVAEFSPWWSRFSPRLVHVGFVMDKVAQGAGFLRVIRSPLPILISPDAQFLLSV